MFKFLTKFSKKPSGVEYIKQKLYLEKNLKRHFSNLAHFKVKPSNLYGKIKIPALVISVVK